MKQRLWSAAVIGALLAGLVSGCTSEPTAMPVDLRTVTSFMTYTPSAAPIPTTTASTTSASPAPAPTTAIASTEPVKTTTSEPTSQPWPADFTPEQAASAQAGLDGYARYLEVTNDAQGAPAEDWTAKVYEVATDPAAEDFLTSTLPNLAEFGVHTTGGFRVDSLRVIAIRGAIMDVAGCKDSSGLRYLDAASQPVSVIDEQPRMSYSAKLGNLGNDRWVVFEEAYLTPRQPC